MRDTRSTWIGRLGLGRGRSEHTIDETTLLAHLAEGWPVWRIAEHHRRTVAEVRVAIGRAVTRADMTTLGR